MAHTINQHCFAANFYLYFLQRSPDKIREITCVILIISISYNLLAQSNGAIWDRKGDMSWF